MTHRIKGKFSAETDVGAASPLCFWIAANPRGFTQRGAKGTLLHRPGLARPMSAEEKGAKDIPARRHGQHKPAATFFNRRGGRCFSGCDWSLCISLRTYQGFKPIAVVPSQPRPAHGVGPWHSSRKYTAVSPGSAVGDLCHSAPMPVFERAYSSGNLFRTPVPCSAGCRDKRPKIRWEPRGWPGCSRGRGRCPP